MNAVTTEVQETSVPRVKESVSTEIVVADRGWVFVGKVAAGSQPDGLTLIDARCIRRWGTSQGLGELINGPLAATKLDPVGTVIISNRAVIARILCSRDW